MPSSTALFFDGPFAGQTREFDREEPPAKLYLRQRPKSPLTNYVRDVNPFDDGPRWIYMTEEKFFAEDQGAVQHRPR